MVFSSPNPVSAPPAPLSFADAVAYFKSRGGVLFLNARNLWEEYAQPPTQLARALAAAGVKVIWLESFGWAVPSPRYPNPHPLLQVRAMGGLPGRRVRLVHYLDAHRNLSRIKRTLRELGERPVIWIQEDLPDFYVKRLPYVDVYSYFDDFRMASPETALYQVPRLLTAQNPEVSQMVGGDREIHTLPPAIDLTPLGATPVEPLPLPPGFPTTRCGYVGSLYEKYFDFDLCEKLISALPELGFVMAGRTDAPGRERLRQLEKYPNFRYLGALKREQLGSVWRALQALILLYRPQPSQLGAYAIKGIEALSCGVAVTGILEPKTRPYQEFFPLAKSISELIRILPQVCQTPKARVDEAYRCLGQLSEPNFQLTEIACRLIALD